jgi:transcriptional regulator with XRE-family HTH domain
MKAAFAAEATRLLQEAGLTAEQIARATGAAPSTVRGWIGRQSEPRGRRAERVAELAAITERLELVMPRSYIRVWLSKLIEALDFEKPIDLIGAGEYRRVAKMISAIEDPEAV